MKLTLRSFIFAALVAAGLVFATAQGAPSYEGPLWSLLDEKQVMSAAAELTPTKLPDCDSVTVDAKSMRVYHQDGIAECQDEYFVKVLTEKGRRQATSISQMFMVPYTSVAVIRLEVIKPNGEIAPVDVAGNSKVSIDDSQMQMNIYDPNLQILRVNIPKVEIGDTIHSVIRTNVERATIPGEYAEDNQFESKGNIRHVLFEVHAPAGKPLKLIRLRNEVKGTVSAQTSTDSDNTLVYRWEVRDVPRMYEEPAMPAEPVVLQRLSLSTMEDWATVSRWYWNVSRPHLEAIDDEMKKTVQTLTTGLTTDEARTKALFYYVSKKIRYMGITPEKDLPGYEPHDVCLTFGKKYGVCRDKAALLVSMLRAAGLPAYPVLVSYGMKKDVEVPNAFFNHAIVAVDRGAAGYLLMDPTDENTLDLLPSMEGNQSYLVCRPEGDVIRTTPVNDPERSMLRVVTTGQLNASGAVEAQSDLSFEGVNDNLYRDYFAQSKIDDRWRFFESNLKHSIPGATLKNLTITPENLLDTSASLHVHLAFTAPNIVAFGSGKALVAMPWIGRDVGIVNFIFSGTGLEKRKYPMQTFVACGVREDISLKVAEAFSASLAMPVCAPQSDEAISYQRAFAFNDGVLSCSRELKFKTVEFSPEQYLGLKKLLATMQTDDRKSPLLATSTLAGDFAAAPAVVALPPVVSDSHISSIKRELKVRDAHAATLTVAYTKEVLNYSGKKKESEVKIPYNPSTSDVKIVHAVVTSKEGKRQEISPEEMNRMDAGWNASAKRYTGGKVLVVSLPGVDIGSRIEMEYEVQYHDKPWLAGFEAFQFNDACDQTNFRLLSPADLGVAWAALNDSGRLKFTTSDATGQRTAEWQGGESAPIPSEWSTPPDFCFRPGVSYAVGRPGEVWQELSAAFVGHAKKSVKAQALAKQLVEEAKDRKSALIIIRNYVDKNIRLAGPAFGDLALRELSDADITLQDGYGHAADRAILLHAMLQAIGFKPEFVVASELPAIPPISVSLASVENPGAFETPLIKVEVEGQATYLNDTDQYARLGATHYDGKLGVLLAGGATFTIQAATDAHEKTEELYALHISDEGKATIGITRRYYGTQWGAKKKFFAELPPEERNRYFQDAVTHVGQGAHPTSALTTDFDRYPGVETFSVEMDRYAVADGKYLYFDLPGTLGLLPTGTDRRALPMFVGNSSQRIVRSEIELPARYQHVVMAPQPRSESAPRELGQVKVETSGTDRHLAVTHTFTVSPGIIEPKEYTTLVGLESRLENKSARLLLLEANR